MTFIDFASRQPAVLARAAEIGQKQTFSAKQQDSGQIEELS
jgi:hypothetical protein